MKKLITFCLSFSLLIFGGLACKNNPLAKFTKQYTCTIPGEPEPNTSDEYFKRAFKHIENNKNGGYNECAFGAVSEAVRLDSKNADAIELRGEFYSLKKDYDAALTDLNEAIRLAPDKPLFYIVRSSVFEKKNMLDKAIEDLSIAMKTDRSHQLYYKRGSWYFKIDDFENALKDYTEAIRLSGDEKYYIMRAEIYRKLGKTDCAEADELEAKEIEDKIVETTDSSSPNNSATKTISGGVLNGKATNLVQPLYPAAARAVRASGAVNVQVTLDENGNVISASAVSGHPLLRASAVTAARESKFSPTLLGGKPVKVTGVVVYNFVP
ncbi:MAG: TonB family protein [Actinomycetota bacterium]